MESILKKFDGFSGSTVLLMENEQHKFVRKIKNIQRNADQLKTLHDNKIYVPKIYSYAQDILDMEYIDGLDMQTYILNFGISALQNFLIELVDNLAKNKKEKNYYDTYCKKLEWVDSCEDLPFDKCKLIRKLPKKLPATLYHGDLTLQNIIFGKNNIFYLIDPLTTEYDSWILDFCKLRQDMYCKWFLRYQKESNIHTYLNILDNFFIQKYSILNDNYLLILILLRVLPYAQKNSFDYNFLVNEVHKLWKL